uniref:Uncharacterized protein n=1 Tax=Anguilla anguilla TaxID=7936 RepID=A0A0E9QES2_ANGAN
MLLHWCQNVCLDGQASALWVSQPVGGIVNMSCQMKSVNLLANCGQQVTVILTFS